MNSLESTVVECFIIIKYIVTEGWIQTIFLKEIEPSEIFCFLHTCTTAIYPTHATHSLPALDENQHFWVSIFRDGHSFSCSSQAVSAGCYRRESSIVMACFQAQFGLSSGSVTRFLILQFCTLLASLEKTSLIWTVLGFHFPGNTSDFTENFYFCLLWT